MKDIVIVIPIHQFNDEIAKLLKDAVDSAPKEFEKRLSCPTALEKDLRKWVGKRKDIVIVPNGEASDFQTLVNNAIFDSKWFSILEFDDEYTPIWFENAKKYMEFMPNISVFLPLTDLVDFESQKFVGSGNEPVWASSFSNTLGTIDNDCLQDFFDFYLTGGIFNTADWEEVGGLKPSVKVSFWYEFLLRLTNKGKFAYVIPKVGYDHYIGRKGSLSDIYRETVTPKEEKYWISTAKKLALFKDKAAEPYKEN